MQKILRHLAGLKITVLAAVVSSANGVEFWTVFPGLEAAGLKLKRPVAVFLVADVADDCVTVLPSVEAWEVNIDKLLVPAVLLEVLLDNRDGVVDETDGVVEGTLNIPVIDEDAEEFFGVAVAKIPLAFPVCPLDVPLCVITGEFWNPENNVLNAIGPIG